MRIPIYINFFLILLFLTKNVNVKKVGKTRTTPVKTKTASRTRSKNTRAFGINSQASGITLESISTTSYVSMTSKVFNEGTATSRTNSLTSGLISDLSYTLGVTRDSTPILESISVLTYNKLTNSELSSEFFQDFTSASPTRTVAFRNVSNLFGRHRKSFTAVQSLTSSPESFSGYNSINSVVSPSSSGNNIPSMSTNVATSPKLVASRNGTECGNDNNSKATVFKVLPHRKLFYHVTSILHSYSEVECGILCQQDSGCKSFNFQQTRGKSQKIGICELNSAVANEFVHHLIAVQDNSYHEITFLP